MSYSNRRNRGRGAFSYFLEFIIIIAGITVSFFLNEWRAAKKAEEKKISLLQEINNDLAKDSIQLELSIKLYQKLLNSHDSLLENAKSTLNEDSLDVYVDQVASYYPFKETQSTFLKIINDPDLVISKQDTLLELFLVIHNQLYQYTHEWTSNDKSFVLEQLLPYMDMHAPFYYPPPTNKSFQGKVFNALKKDDAFMNLLKSGRSYKSAILQVYGACLSQLKTYKSKVNNRLEKPIS